MDRLVALKGEAVAVREMRKHLAWYLKGFKGSARIKDVIMEETKRDDMVRILDQFVSQLHMVDNDEPSTSAASPAAVAQ